MYSQKRRDLEQTISQLEADKAKLKKQIISAAARSRRSEQQCELAESKFSELERSTEDLHLQYNNLQASYNALTAQLEQAEKRTSAATTQAAAMESQLSKIKVIGCCGSRQYIFSIISFWGHLKILIERTEQSQRKMSVTRFTSRYVVTVRWILLFQLVPCFSVDLWI